MNKSCSCGLWCVSVCGCVCVCAHMGGQAVIPLAMGPIRLRGDPTRAKAFDDSRSIWPVGGGGRVHLCRFRLGPAGRVQSHSQPLDRALSSILRRCGWTGAMQLAPRYHFQNAECRIPPTNLFSNLPSAMFIRGLDWVLHRPWLQSVRVLRSTLNLGCASVIF